MFVIKNIVMRVLIKQICFLALSVLFFGSAYAEENPGDYPQKGKKNVLMVGGGGSHDFQKWYGEVDLKLINSMEGMHAIYTENTDSIKHYLKNTDLLILTNNQPISAESQQAIEKFVAKGKPLVLLHAALWYNWEDWPKYNKEYVAGGSTSHEDYGEFNTIVVNPIHPINKGVTQQFPIKDELYRHIPDADSKGIEVLAIGQSKVTSEVFPVVFVVKHSKSKIVGITLGHDAESHLLEPYKALLVNSIEWVFNK